MKETILRSFKDEVPINEIFTDGKDYRLHIFKRDIPASHDWSIEIDKLWKNGLIMSGITSDRFDDFIYIWVTQKVLK